MGPFPALRKGAVSPPLTWLGKWSLLTGMQGGGVPASVTATGLPPESAHSLGSRGLQGPQLGSPELLRSHWHQGQDTPPFL